MTKIRFWCPVHFEPWDYRNYVERGIGGSETCVCEMSWRLAQRGYDVAVYSPRQDGTAPEWRGVRWQPLDAADFTEEALWIVCRQPIEVERRKPQGRVWVMCQDESYPGQWTEETVERTEVVMALSGVHARHMAGRDPQIAPKIKVTSNGVRVDLFERIERAGGVERHPRRCIYASSPDRGLAQALLPLWPQIRERVPDAELHVYYGFDNIDKMVAWEPKRFGWLGKLAYQAREGMKQPGVVWHGRVGQEELYRAWLSSAAWLYPSDFTETSCVTCMEAQASGAIPVTRPWWAVSENVKHGVFVQGRMYSDPLARAQFVDATCKLLLDEAWQESIRPAMMQEARARCHWERIVDQWEAWLHGWPERATHQFAFQHRHMEGRTLNVGCGCDLSGLRERGAVNLDVRAVDPGTGWPNRADVLADARSLPYDDREFDTAILGDILEHCEDADARRIAGEAWRVARRVVITCPDDHRPPDGQTALPNGARPEYAAGIGALHERPMPRERLLALLPAKPAFEQPLRYDWCDGVGLVLEAA